MELDLDKGYVDIAGIHIQIEELTHVGLMNFVFENVKVTFVYLDDGNYFFMYSDSNSYAELLKTIAGNPSAVGGELRRYQNDYGVEHELWTQLLQGTLEKFNISEFTYSDKCGVSFTTDYFSLRYNKFEYFPRKVNSTEKAYVLLNSVLPQNLSATRKKYLKQECEDRLKTFTDICGNNFENKEAYLSHLEAVNMNDIDKWRISNDELQFLKTKIQKLAQEEVFDLKRNNDIQWFLEYCITYVSGRIDKMNENMLYKQYGPTSSLKKALRESLNRLGFMELLELFKDYKEKEKVLTSKARCAGKKQGESPYKEYVDIYRLGSVLISDKMNQLNRNKAKNKYIPQELLDEALIFYYDTASAEEAYTERSNEKYSQDKQSGDKGEQKVEYALKWLDKSYIQIQKRSYDRLGNSCIYIFNPDFVAEKQEYDHLIVSDKGVFNIETKNYTGKLIIDKYGNWIRKKNNEEEGIKNPLQQVRQHEKILMSFLTNECKIISIICIANDKAIIEGSENCPIPIVKSDMLVEFIENWDKNEIKLSEAKKEECVKAIYEHMA